MAEIPFWVHEDHVRGVALIRGRGVRPYLPTTARWSVVGKGHVVPIDTVPDMLAAAELDGVRYRVKSVVT